MKKIILVIVAALVTDGVADAAQQAINQITTPTTSREALRNAVNTENAKAQSNFVELYAATPNDTAYGSAWNSNLRAPSMNAVYDKIEALILGAANLPAGTEGQSLSYDATNTLVAVGVKTLTYTASASPSAADLLANKYITNYGATGTIAITLPALSYEICRGVIVEDNQIIQVTPPTGEAFDLSGTTLTVNQSFAGPATVGAKAVVCRQRNAVGSWIWSADVVRGTWAGI